MAPTDIAREVEEAIADVRSDKCDKDWLLAGFESKSSIRLLGSGSGGIDELKKHVISGDVCYGLVRKDHVLETAGSVSAKNTKFVWIYWRPEDIPVARKMVIGPVEGQIKRLFSPYHTDLQASVESDIGEQQLKELLDGVTNVVDRTGNKKATGAALGSRSSVATVDRREAHGFLPTGTAADTANKSVGGAEVTFDDLKRLREELLLVRSDHDESQWVLFGYKDVRTLTFVASGPGGVEEMLAQARDDVASYGILRCNDKFDMTANVRFCFITWQPDELSPMQKAKISTHIGAVKPKFREHLPWHYEFRAAKRSDLTSEIISSHIGALTGSKSRVLEGAVADTVAAGGDKTAGSAAPSRHFLGGVSDQVSTLEFIDEAALREAIARVRRDDDPSVDFCVARFEGNKLTLHETGSGSVEALKACLRHDEFMYGLVRVYEKIDSSTTVKFAYIRWLPNGVSATIKGRLGVLAGAVTRIFEPFHGDIVATDLDDVSSSSVEKCVSNLRGTNKCS
jgi:hypothetical protein